MILLGIISNTIIAEQEDKYVIDKVLVVDVKNNKIIVDYTKYNYDDYSVLEIKKPFYANPTKGELINICYPSGKPEEMHYIINKDYADRSLSYGVFLFEISGFFSFIVWVISKIIYLSKKNKRKRKSNH